MPKPDIRKQIDNAVKRLTKLPEFESWFKAEKISPGLVLLNNSFIFRQNLKTTKNPHYLVVPVTSGNTLGLTDIKVAQGLGFNTDFKFIPSAAQTRLTVEPLASAIDRQVKQLGKVVFVLIGEILNTVKSSELLGHSLFASIQLDPSSKNLLSINGQVITINSAADDEALLRINRTLALSLLDPRPTSKGSSRQTSSQLARLPSRNSPLMRSSVSRCSDQRPARCCFSALRQPPGRPQQQGASKLKQVRKSIMHCRIVISVYLVCCLTARK